MYDNKITFIKTAIIEDNEVHAGLLEKYLVKWSKYKHVPLEINRYLSAEEFLFEWEPGLGFSVLFIDIQMHEINGIDLAKSVRKKDSEINIVFTTGITGYMAEGYEVEALHYLVKPVNEDKIYKCMDKLLNKRKDINYIIVHSKDEIHKLATNQINYIEARGHGCVIEIFTKENNLNQVKRTEISESISELETILPEQGFIKCHRSYLCCIQNIHHIGKTEITFDTGSHIPVSRRLHKDVNQAFIQYFSRLVKI